MSKIGDLFVRLGLKKDDFDKGLKDATGKLEGFLSKVKSFGGIMTTVMAAAAAAVTKFAKDAVSMTQKWGDEWAVTMAGIKGAYEAFVRQIASGEGWSNLFANMREAARVAREVAETLDEIFERKISFSYESAKVEREIAELQNIMRDSSKSVEERKKAAQDIIDKEAELAAIKKDIAVQEANALHTQFENITKLKPEQRQFLVDEYNANRQIILQARQYNEERAKLEANRQQFSRTGATRQAAEEAEALRQLSANTADNVKQVAKLVENYDKSNDELVEGLMRADVAVIQVDTDMLKAQSRATAMLGSLSNTGDGGSKLDPDAARAAAVLKRAQDSAKNEIQLLYEKYQTEKQLLEQYDIDTTALTEEYFRNLQKIMEKGLDDAFKPIEDMEPIEVEPIEIDWEGIDAELEEWITHFNSQLKTAEQITEGFRSAVVGGFSNACQELMGQLMGLDEVNSGAVVKALLTPLADMAIKAGEIILTTGEAVEALKAALTSIIAGPLAIAAGLALIAVGSAAKAGLAAIAKGGSATTAVAASGYSGSTGAGGTQNLETELTIYIEGRLSGEDIVLAGQRTLNSWGR